MPPGIRYFRTGRETQQNRSGSAPLKKLKKNKKEYQTLPEGATLTTQHTARLFQFLRHLYCMTPLQPPTPRLELLPNCLSTIL